MFQDLITEIMGMVGKFEHPPQTHPKIYGLQKCQGKSAFM